MSQGYKDKEGVGRCLGRGCKNINFGAVTLRILHLAEPLKDHTKFLSCLVLCFLQQIICLWKPGMKSRAYSRLAAAW